MLDLRKLTTKEFAELINEDFDTIYKLMKDCSHLGYTDKPYAHIVENVQRANLVNNTQEIVAKFIYTGICNRPEHRFYNGRGYGIELRGC